MLIKAYLFSKIAMQLGHTYYSVPDFSTGPSKFYYNLNDYGAESFMLNESFIYEVEIYPETIFVCSDKYLQARKYKIIRYVSVFEYLNELDLPDDFLNEIAEIGLRSTSDSLKHDFYSLFNKSPEQLSPYEKLKFLAILNKAQEIPSVTIEESYQAHYIKLFEFYRVPYEVRQSSTNYGYGYGTTIWTKNGSNRSNWTPKHSSTVSSYKSTPTKIEDASASAILTLVYMYGPDAQEVIETLVNLYKSGILNSTYVRQSEKEIEDEIVTLVSDAIDNIF